MKSQNVVCCGASKWVSVIGWLQLIINGLVMSFFTFFLIWLVSSFCANFWHIKEQINKNPDRKEELERQLLIATFLTVATFLIVIAAFLIGVVGGFLLITGVKQKNARKLKVWMIMELVYLTFLISGIVLGTLWGGANYYIFIADALTILPPVFYIWVVNVHRQELLGKSGGKMRKGSAP